MSVKRTLDKAIKCLDAEPKSLPHVRKAAEALGVDPSELEDGGTERGASVIISKKTGAVVARYHWTKGKLTLTGNK